MLKRVMTWVAGPLAVAGFGLLLLAERKRPLRRPGGDKLQRIETNIALASTTALAIRLLFLPVVTATARLVEKRKLGLLNLIALPRPVKRMLALVLLDYTFYWWHRLLHVNRFLWRFHAVHHTDLELDVSTSARFHFGEWIFSTAYRAGQVIVIGADELTVAVFETAEMLAAEFHHSNIRIPVEIERRLNCFIVTPRMHGIHHSIIESETDSNWATVLTLWDRLHNTLKLDVPQDEITIGPPGSRDARELTLPALLLMPFINEHREDETVAYNRALEVRPDSGDA